MEGTERNSKSCAEIISHQARRRLRDRHLREGVIVNLSTLTDRELYRLSWDISEELVEREMARLCQHSLPDSITGVYEIARPTPKYAFNSLADNYGAW